jgi:hypothetical protein
MIPDNDRLARFNVTGQSEDSVSSPDANRGTIELCS